MDTMELMIRVTYHPKLLMDECPSVPLTLDLWRLCTSYIEATAPLLIPFDRYMSLYRNRLWKDSLPEPFVQALYQLSQQRDSTHLITEDEIRRCLQNDEVWDACFSYQKRNVRRCIQMRGRAYIADDMGCGKTRQASLVLQYFERKHAWTTAIIIGPSVALGAWKQELDQTCHWTAERVHQLSNGKQAQKLLEDISSEEDPGHVFIVSYDLFRNIQPNLMMWLKRGGRNVKVAMILDEAHYLINPTATRTKSITEFVETYCTPPHGVLLMLSGTPYTTPNELFPQLHLLQPNVFATYMDYAQNEHKTFGFVNRYCLPYKDHFHHWVLNRPNLERMDEFLQVFRACGMVRNLKEDVLADLPTKVRERVLLPVQDTEAKRIFLESIKRLDAAASSSNRTKQQQYEIMMLWNEQVTLRIPPVIDYFKQLWTSASKEEKDKKEPPSALPQKWVVFAFHSAMMDALDELAQFQLGWKTIRIDGSVPSAKRQVLAQQFQTDPNVRVAILNLQAGSTAITLTAANVLYFAECHPNDKINKQAENRIHRIGQTSNVRVITLVVENSIDHRFDQILKRKYKHVDQSLDQRQIMLAQAEGQSILKHTITSSYS